MRPDAGPAIRARLVAAMEKRAAGLDGEARRALDARLARLGMRPAGAADEAPVAGAGPRQGPLRELLEQLAGSPSADRSAYPDLPALADFRRLWSNLRADSQLQQSVAPAPADAGPLNSAALASRAIALMREASPEYLRSFLAYVDELAWLERLGGAGCATASGVPATRRRARRKP